MISIQNEDGVFLRGLLSEGVYGFHPRYGFVSRQVHEDRRRMRRRRGLLVGHFSDHDWLFGFKLEKNGGVWKVAPTQDCQAVPTSDGWRLESAFGNFQLKNEAGSVNPLILDTEEEKDRLKWALAILVPSALLLMLFLLPQGAPVPTPVTAVEEPVMVKVIQDTQKAVPVKPTGASLLAKNISEHRVQERRDRAAVAQNLGFLGVLGKKELKNALGGMPTSLKDASAGAGPGGKEGSGGELLVGLGEGVKHTTVGNTGVAGLGGIGTGKGPGGGAGGYGNSLVASADAQALSKLGIAAGVSSVSQDMTLDGGLDRLRHRGDHREVSEPGSRLL